MNVWSSFSCVAWLTLCFVEGGRRSDGGVVAVVGCWGSGGAGKGGSSTIASIQVPVFGDVLSSSSSLKRLWKSPYEDEEVVVTSLTSEWCLSRRFSALPEAEEEYCLFCSMCDAGEPAGWYIGIGGMGGMGVAGE